VNKSTPDVDTEKLLSRAVTVLRIESDAVAALASRIDSSFADACRLILGCAGRVVVSGIGKSGHIGRKIAATLASTGTPAFFVHAGEASHGDLGMVTRDDVVIALSNSGTTAELLNIVPLIKRSGARLVAVTGNPGSELARLADVHLNAAVDREACPLNLAPTASTTAMLALGDALAVALLEARGFGPDDFALSHPGGTLGRALLTHVGDVMRSGANLPVVGSDARLVDAVLEITRKRMGMTAVLDAAGQLVGIFTDGDLRRFLEHGDDPRTATVSDVMSRQPVTIEAEALAVEAVRRMEERLVSQLLVVDGAGKLVGALHIHDLLSAKVV